VQKYVRAALIAAVYIVLIYILQPVSFGPLQFRAAEALALLPMIYPEAVAGLFVGVLLANIFGGLGPWDIFGGSAITLIAAYVTYRCRDSWIAYASPIVFNALLVSAYLHRLYSQPYWLVAGSIAVSEAVVVLLLGIPLVKVLQKIA